MQVLTLELRLAFFKITSCSFLATQGFLSGLDSRGQLSCAALRFDGWSAFRFSLLSRDFLDGRSSKSQIITQLSGSLDFSPFLRVNSVYVVEEYLQRLGFHALSIRWICNNYGSGFSFYKSSRLLSTSFILQNFSYCLSLWLLTSPGYPPTNLMPSLMPQTVELRGPLVRRFRA